MGQSHSSGPRAGIGGRPTQKFCIRGHDLDVTRGRERNGATYCKECRKLRSRKVIRSTGPRAGIGGPAVGGKCSRGHDMAESRVFTKFGPRCGACTKIVRSEYRKKNPDVIKASQLRKYGLDLETYRAMLASQNGSCAICSQPPTDKPLSVDHCHKTGKVRGLLCSKCNSTIGLAGDNVETLASAIEYLRTR